MRMWALSRLLRLRLALVAPPRFLNREHRRCTLLRPALLLLLLLLLSLLMMRMVNLRWFYCSTWVVGGRGLSRPSTRSRRSPSLRVSEERPVLLTRHVKVTMVAGNLPQPLPRVRLAGGCRLRWQTRPRVVSDPEAPCPVHRRRRCYCLEVLLRSIVERRRKMIVGGRRRGGARGKEVGREGAFDRSRGARLSRRRRRRRLEASHSFVEDSKALLLPSWNRLLWEERRRRRRREEEEMEDGIENRRQRQRLRQRVATRRE